jgi:hypothetical protein
MVPGLLQTPTMGSKDNFEAADPVTVDRVPVAAGDVDVVPAPVHPAARIRRIQRTIMKSGPIPFRLLSPLTGCIFISGSTLPGTAIIYRPGIEYFPVI